MFDLFEHGTPESIHTIASYCVVDCDLPLNLLFKLSIIPNATEMARVCHTKYVDLFTGGQQRKVFNQLVNKTKDKWVINKIKIQKPDSYVGATVLNPKPGFHLLISTLDFASLYPSIIRMENLCYSTWVHPDNHMRVKNMANVKYKMHTAGGKKHMFVTSQKGILPELEEELLAARKIAKKAMKLAKENPFEYAIQNGRQLALKVSMNSIYGFTGVSNGYLPCWPIAAVTTTVGRSLILKTKELVESTYTKQNGYEADAKTVYGDSVSGKTPLLLRIHGEVQIMPIEKLKLTDEHPVYTWTEKGWTQIQRVICHKLAKHKKMLRIFTHSGIVDCTNDHSLLTPSGMPISPDGVEVGVTELLHSYPKNFRSRDYVSIKDAKLLGRAFFSNTLNEVPTEVLNGSEKVKRAFLGHVIDPIEIKHKCQRACAGIYYLLQSLGYHCGVAYAKGAFVIRVCSESLNTVVKKLLKSHMRSTFTI